MGTGAHDSWSALRMNKPSSRSIRSMLSRHRPTAETWMENCLKMSGASMYAEATLTTIAHMLKVSPIDGIMIGDE